MTPAQPIVERLPPVFLVEDDRVAAAAIEAQMRRMGLANPVLVIGDGTEAVERLGEAADSGLVPALVLLDRMLPGLSGMDVLRWASNHPRIRNVPVIMITASVDADAIAEAHSLGASSYLVKPVGISALPEVLNDLNVRWAILEPEAQ